MRAKLLSIFAVLALLAWVPVVAQIPDEPVHPTGEEQAAPQDQGYAEDQPVIEDPLAGEPAVPADPVEDPMAAEPAVPADPVQDPIAVEPADPMATESESATDVTTETEADAGYAAGAEEELPRTASPLALLALLGGAGVASGFGVRRLRRR